MRILGQFAFTLVLLLSVSFTCFSQNKSFDLDRMDNSIEACDDFYQYSNGTWLKNTSIPPQLRWWGNFKTISENNQKILKEIIETAAGSKAKQGSNDQLIGDYFNSCMNETVIESNGISPIKPYLEEIDSVKNNRDLQLMIAKLQNYGFVGIFGFYVTADNKNNTSNLVVASQGELGLPNKDYWLKDEEKYVETRKKYSELITNMFKHSGNSAEVSASNAAVVMSMQKRLASFSKTPEELRNSEENYNKKRIRELKQLSPNFSWEKYLAQRGISNVKEINIAQPKFFEGLDKMLMDVPLRDWKILLRWNVIFSSAGQLSKVFRDEQFNFSSKFLAGVQQQQERSKICTAEIDGFIGDSLGQEFVKRTFRPDSKRILNKLIDNLFAVYKQRITGLAWMDEKTKLKAFEKLNSFSRKIGYPEKFQSYKGLKINSTSYFSNNLNASAFRTKQNLAKASTRVDRSEWKITPQTVNAFNDPVLNEIIFPAGILQPPFFDPTADDAITYGGIGSVIGHEITHGFDDQGSLSDPKGNLVTWWTDSDKNAFNQRTTCLVDQFNRYRVVDEVFLNGKLTLGENIADLGGLTMSYYAFEKSIEGNLRPSNLDGFTPEQRFFLGWAQSWAEKSTPQREILIARTNPHSVSRFRVNGPLSNMPEFKKAFGCKENDKMVRSEVCKIW